MKMLLIFLTLMFVCYLIARKSGGDRSKFPWVSKMMSIMVYGLVFLMGMRMGANDEVISGLTTIGIQAVSITLFVMGGTILAAFGLRKILGLNRYGKKSISEETIQVSHDEEAFGVDKKDSLKSSFIILLVVIAGMLAGYLVIPMMFKDINQFQSLSGTALNGFLCLLLAFVGFDLGLCGSILDKFKSIGLKALLMPIAVIIGTLGLAAVYSLFSTMSMKETLAIGAGFGWYSLAPGIIMDAGYAAASAVSFLHNVLREILSILFLPVISSKIGYFEATAMPGAPGMDVCLPMVEKTTNGEMAIYSLVSGLILSLLVPVLVPLIIN